MTITTKIDNPWWPMAPGSRWVYRETAPDGTNQRVVVTVTGRTKRIANGITARVVRDVASEHGKPVEITDDWYAQDAAGNVWYLGEDTAAYTAGGKVSHQGSFEAGVQGAQPGIAMPAEPRGPGAEGPGAEVLRSRRRARAEPAHRRSGRALGARPL